MAGDEGSTLNAMARLGGQYMQAGLRPDEPDPMAVRASSTIDWHYPHCPAWGGGAGWPGDCVCREIEDEEDW